MIIKSSTALRNDYGMISELAHDEAEPIYITKLLLTVVVIGMLLLVGCSRKEICTLDGCTQEVYKNGYCIDHYVPVKLKMTQRVPDVLCNGDHKKINDKWVTIASTDIDVGKITWTSSDDSVLHITDDGRLECMKNGSATLTVTSEDGGSDSKRIQCYTSRATDIAFDVPFINLKVGDVYQLSPSTTPSDGYAEIKYSLSSDTDCISLSDTGLITALAPTSLVIVTAELVGTNHAPITAYISVIDDYYKETGILPLKVVSGRYITDSVGGNELYFNFKNNSDRDIKYIDFQVALYNAVNDEISDEISGDKGLTIRYTGPLTAGSTTGEFTGTRKFYNPSFKGNLVFNYVTITYMNNSTEDIPADKLRSSDFLPWAHNAD